MHQTIAELRHEHGVIIRRLYELSLAVDSLRHDRQPSFDDLFSNLELLTAEPDTHHHPKEERLFDLVCERLQHTPELIRRLRDEHHQLRSMGLRLRDQLAAAAAGEPTSRERIVSLCHDYIHAQRWHIAQEETGLYRLAENSLSAGDWLLLRQRLARDGLLTDNSPNREA